MLKIFRKLRHQVLKQNNFTSYLLYAIGEIILIVFGILIAMQINNANEDRKRHVKEISYLQGIQADMELNLSELEEYIVTRQKAVNSAGIVLEYFEGERKIDPNEFNLHNLNVQIWSPFNVNDNTYQELVNSGNLGIISNDSIRDVLLDMQLSYKNIAFIENHMRHDFENYIYPEYFTIADLNPAIKNYTFQVSKGAAGAEIELSKKEVRKLLKSQTLKNGFVLSIYNNGLLIDEYNSMIRVTDELIKLIERELQNN